MRRSGAVGIASAWSAVLLLGIPKGTVSLYFPSMSQKKTEPLYKFYRNLSGVAHSLASLFHEVDQFPDNPRCHFELGEAAHQAGLLKLSAECFLRVTELAPNVEAGFFNLGNSLFDLREFNKARQAYEQAFRLNPDCGTLNNLGNSLAAMQDWDNAILTFDRALNLPTRTQIQARTAIRNKGKALIASENWDGAIENYRIAVQLFPNETEFSALKAKCHQQKFEFPKAAECLVEALVASPNNPELLCQLSDINFSRGRTLESLLCMNQAFSAFRPPATLHSRWLQMLNFCVPGTPDRLLSEAKGWANSVNANHPNSPTDTLLASSEQSVSSNDQPVRVGILCSSLPSRGLQDWLPYCMAKCTPARVQWFLYCDQPICNSTQEALDAAGCRTEVTSQLSDEALAKLITTHQVTVLIDMIGHGLSTRLQAVASKPAPIQISWCAFPSTSGLSQMDFIWSDHIAIPPESEKYFSEKVFRFPTTSFCFQPSDSISPTLDRDASASPFRCGFLGQPEQISEPLIEAMRSILESIPDAELVFIGSAYRDLAFQSEIRGKIEHQPTDASRIRFECFESAVDELSSYQQLDVSLDSFLVSSPQRTCESLWMGVPVVTHLDERFAGRCSASILNALHRNAWITDNQVGYVSAVKQLSECRSVGRQQRTSLRSELLMSPVCDLDSMANNLHSLIDEAIRQSKAASKEK